MNRREVKRAPVLRFKGFTNDWEQRKLKNLVDFYSGLTYHPENIREKGTFVIRSSNIKDGQLVTGDNIFVAPEIVNSTYVKKDDIIVVVRNGSRKLIGKHTKLNFNLNNAVIGAFMTGIRSNNNNFINAIFDSDNFKREIHKNLGATINQITTGELKRMNFYIPSLTSEQNYLGNLMKVLDKLITLQQRKLKLLKEIRKGIVENIRDNNFEYKEQKNDFKDVKIKDMFKITRGKVLPKEKISSNKISPNIYPVFSSQTLNNGLLGFYKDYLFQNAITWTTDGANAGTVNFRNEKFYSTNVNGVLLQKKIKPDLLTADLLNLVAFKYVSKVGNPKLMNNTMANIRIKIPSNTNARIFYSKILNKYDTKIDFINKKIDYLTTFKRFLLQNMFI